MKNRKKALLLVLCAVLLLTGSIMGSYAFLVDREQVENTFTIGAVEITLDEADVTELGVLNSNDRIQNNEYKLIPGRTYIKDPTVHVHQKSESCWLFVKVENGISSVENSENTIESQILSNDWTALEGEDGVYYRQYIKGEPTDHQVFATFSVAGPITGEDLAALTEPTVKVTAYAIQLDGFENNLSGAWEAVSAKAAP